MTDRLRSATAWAVSASAGYLPAQWALGQMAGGFVAAYHDLPADRFVAQVEALAPNRPISLSELVLRLRQGKSTSGLFALTLDDGVGTTVRDIAQACEAHGWPVTFYLPSGYLDDGRGMPFQWLAQITPYLPADFDMRGMERAMWTQPRELYEPVIQGLVAGLLSSGRVAEDQIQPPAPIPWEEVSQLSRNPLVNFGSHGVSHTALSALSEEGVERELRTSQDRISSHTGRPCRDFCYPFGGPESIGERVPALVQRFYDSATTMSRGRLKGADCSLLPRIPIYAKDDPKMARLKILTP